VVSTSISFPQGLAIDPYDMNLFWVDSKLDKIEVVSLTGSDSGGYYRKVIVETGLQPHGIALDLRHK